MSDGKTCPECGAELGEDAPQGLCPKCLMAKAMEDSGEEHPQTALPRAAAQEFGGATQNVSPADTPTTPSDPNETAPSQVDLGSVESDVAAALEPPGKYSVLGQYGKGGMGRVLLVHDDHLGRDIALKELLPGLVDDSTPGMAEHIKEMTGRFLREAKITGQLEHPSITPVHELGRRDDGTLYYTMKLIRGKTLAQAIQDAGSYEERLKLLPHFVDLCNAIAYAHARGVIHRDIKPSNVMVGEFGETVVIDWGLAKVKGRNEHNEADPLAETILSMKAGKEDDSAKTRYGQAMGTPAYMPPEQATGDLDAIDERSDIYSLGAVLYEILTGQPPYTGESAQDVMRKVVTQSPRPAREIESRIDKELVRIYERAMKRDPSTRYGKARVLARRIEQYTPIKLFENPFKSMVQRVPELRPFPATSRMAIVDEATSRMRRDNPRLFAFLHYRLYMGIAVLVVSFMIIMGFQLTTITLAKMCNHWREQAMVAHTAMLQLQSPGREPVQLNTESSDVWIAEWIEENEFLVGLSVYFLGAVFLAMFVQGASSFDKAYVPYVREVIAEWEAKGSFERSLPPLSRNVVVLQFVSLFGGLAMGCLAGWGWNSIRSEEAELFFDLVAGGGIGALAVLILLQRQHKQRVRATMDGAE